MDNSYGCNEAQSESYKSNHEQSWTDFSNAHTDSRSSRFSIIERAVQRKAHIKTQESDQESETVAESEQVDSQANSTAAPYCGTKPDIDFRNSAQKCDIFYSPNVYLQGTLSEKFFMAKRTRRPFIIEAFSEKIVFFPELDQFYTTFDAKALRSICTQKLKLVATRTLGTPEAIQMEQVISSTDELIDSDVFLWNVALLTSQGRIPMDTDPEAPVRLKLCPDFNRLTPTPHAELLASLWSKRAVSLLETASILPIPQRYVFAFYNATNTLGLISVMANPHNGISDTQEAEVAREPNKFLNAFARIIRR